MRSVVDVRTRSEDKIRDDCLARIDAIKNERSAWESKCDRLYRHRYGFRAAKTFPFVGASNLHFGLIDKTIRKLKANFIRLAWGIQPIASIQARDMWLGRRLEHFTDWLIRIRMNGLRPLAQAIDNMLSYGRGIVKCIWRYDREAVTDVRDTSELFQEGEIAVLNPLQIKARLAGAFGLDLMEDSAILEELMGLARQNEELRVRHEATLHEEPQWLSVDPRALYVPSDTASIQDAEFLAHFVAIPLAIYEQRTKGRKPTYRRIPEVDKWIERSITKRPGDVPMEDWGTDQDLREDITSRRTSTLELYECCFRYDVNRDRIGEKVVMTIHKPTKQILRFIEYPYEHSDWAYTDFPFEVTQDRWYAPRGIAELLESIQTEVNVQHNAKIDAMTIANAPIMFYDPITGIEPEDIRWVPGDAYPARRPQESIYFPTLNAREVSYEREEQILKAWAEEMTGLIDIAMAGPNSLTEPRTASEIDALQAQAGAVFGSDAVLFQDAFRRLVTQTLALWRQYGPETTEIRVIGEALPIRVTREDLAGNFDLIPSGTPANTATGARLSKALQFLQVAGGLQAPNVDYPGLIRWIAQLLDYPMAERIITPMSVPMTQAQAERQMQEIIFMVTIDGYKSPVLETDDHPTHAKVIETYLKTNQEKLQGTPAGDAILEHGLMHQQYAQKATGGRGLRQKPEPSKAEAVR